VTGNYVTWPQVTGSDPEVTSFEQKSPGCGRRGQKLRYTVHFTSYKAVTHRRGKSHPRKWRHVTSGDWTWPRSDSFDGSHLEVAVKGRKLSYTVHFTTYKAVARRRRQSRDRKWRHVTSGDRKWPGSDLEVAVEGLKLAYPIHFTTYKAVSHRRRQSRDKKWCLVTSGDQKCPGSDAIWPELTWKQL